MSGMVKIFAFPRSKSGIFDLILKKISHSRSVSYRSNTYALNMHELIFLPTTYSMSRKKYPISEALMKKKALAIQPDKSYHIIFFRRGK